jgi:hypothetical protein
MEHAGLGNYHRIRCSQLAEIRNCGETNSEADPWTIRYIMDDRMCVEELWLGYLFFSLDEFSCYFVPK